MVGTADDDQLRWLYANCAGLVAASHEDYGLTPIEALAFGRPTAALGAGGYLDTVVDGTTGLLFDRPDPALIARAVTELMSRAWDQSAMAAHADNFTEARFAERLWAIVAEA
jgi:glycosyltransferase involved in cell wall biosynthesis